MGEIALRLVAPQPTGPVLVTHDETVGRTLVPGLRGTVTLPGVYRFETSHLADGTRATQLPTVRPRARVLFLGDSFAYGLGVSDLDAAPSLLASALPHIGVINAGVPGTGPDGALRRLQVHGERWDPDLVVLLLYANDAANAERRLLFDLDADGRLVPVPSRDEAARTKARLARLPGFDLLARHSHGFSLARRYALALSGRHRGWADPDQAPSPPTPDQLDLLTQILAETRDEAQRLDASLLLAYAPHRAEVEAGSSALSDSLGRIADTLGVPFVATLDSLARDAQPRRPLYFEEGHWTERGHGLATRALRLPIARELSRRGHGARRDAPASGARGRRSPAD